jgi:hypothetical protein
MRGLELGHPVIHYLRTFGPPTHALEVVGAAQNGCQLYEAGPKSACLILYVFIGYWVRDENPWNTTQKKNVWLVVDLPLWKIWLRQLGLLFPIYGNIKHAPNHQPDVDNSSIHPFCEQDEGGSNQTCTELPLINHEVLASVSCHGVSSCQARVARWALRLCSIGLFSVFHPFNCIYIQHKSEFFS